MSWVLGLRIGSAVFIQVKPEREALTSPSLRLLARGG